MNATRYTCAGRTFDTLPEACAWAAFLFKVSGLVVAVEAAA
jgi:hypothetical protein